MHDSDFIAAIASIYKPSTYLELGLCQGETFHKILPYVNEAHGVDVIIKTGMQDLLNRDNVKLYNMTTDLFFESNNLKFDMAFIDADHCATSALKDFENCLMRLNPGGIILMHDTDPINDILMDPKFCGDSYKIIPILEKRNDINIVTLPLSGPGVSIITKKDDTRTKRRNTASY